MRASNTEVFVKNRLRMIALSSIFIFIFIFIGVAGISAGPFGLEFGMSEAELEEIAFIDEETESGYLWIIPPKPSEDFTEYYVRISPSIGIFEIQALGKILETSAKGDEIRAEFRKIEKFLIQKYGKPTSTYDSIETDSALSDPEDWMKAIQTGDRYFESYWIAEDGAELPGKMNFILLEIDAMEDDETQAYLVLIYESVDWEEGDADA
ncbi:MAG: hypothetical protein LLF89_03350 [Spirochaetaceae bacterium]|nr:hypothetical protein [Spirochaetaceae bacterium]